MDTKLWDYADGLLSANEQVEMQQQLAEDTALQKRYKTVCEQRDMLREQVLLSPKSDFSSNVMQAWSLSQSIDLQEVESKKDWTLRIITGFLLSLLILLLGLTIYNLKGATIPSMPSFSYKPIYMIGLAKLLGLSIVLFIDQYRHYKKQIALIEAY